MLIGVLSDTHGRLPSAILRAFEGVEVIIHCGDVGGDEVLSELATIAPVKAVCGNVDGSPSKRLPLSRVEEFGGRIIAVTHGHLIARHGGGGYGAGLVEAFRARRPAVICYGHTHRYAEEWIEGILVLNPGAIFRPRDGHFPSAAILTIKDNSILASRIIMQNAKCKMRN
ncbi:MAG: metallophosphoesterase family protein [Candidatus Sumerlaeota bacterium]|nr:metallophosphoesterase family protein [Candidatus Sumerlaeota bacterium]